MANMYRDMQKFYKDRGRMDEFGRAADQTYLIHLDTLRLGRKEWGDGHPIGWDNIRRSRKFVIAHWRGRHGITVKMLSFLPFAKSIILRRLIKESSIWKGNTERFNSYGVPSEKQGGTN